MIARYQAQARAIVRDRDALVTFWKLVGCPAGDGACWRWHGGADRYGRSVMRVGYATVHAVRVASYAVTGRYPTETRFTQTCADPLCVRPSHVRWRVSGAVRRATLAHSDGYFEATTPVQPDVEMAAIRRHADGSTADDRRRS